MITVISYPSNEINYSFNEGVTTNSNEIVKLLNVNVAEAVTDTFIEINVNGVIFEINILDECRYKPIDVVFLNKDGQQGMITMFKERVNTFDVSKDTFESSYLQPLNGYHQFNDYNIQGRTTFRINTGFIDESMNEVIKELMLSKQVYIVENDIFVPVNLSQNSIEYKTRAKDRLINYEFTFKYSFNEINTI